MTRAYVSATFEDLQECRGQVSLALRRLGVEDIAMEYYVAESKRPLDRCLRDVAECDLYLGVFTWRYGYIPPGKEQSITELEYRAADANGKPTLIFLLKEEAPWPRSLMDRDAIRIESLRDELHRDKMCNFFATPDELAAFVTMAVSHQLSAQSKRRNDIFVSYRRQENGHFTGRLCDRLIDSFGEGRIFIDVDTIGPGVDFTENISNAVKTSAVLLAIIGPHWLSAVDEEGRRRLEDPDDIVRLEIEAALAENVRIIPILVDSAAMPRKRDLPNSLARLARFNAFVIRHESFRSDAERLVNELKNIIPRQ
jgi:hypothetical protein